MLKLITANLVRNQFSETRYFRIHQIAPPFVPINSGAHRAVFMHSDKEWNSVKAWIL
jgi:hypothetical protein